MTQSSPPLYAIGDVHGQFEKLAEAMGLIEEDGGLEAQVVVLGDLVDRGPDSFRVVEHLRRGIAEGRNWTVLRGNHDQMFVNFLTRGTLTHPRTRRKLSWLDPVMGGRETLASYGVQAEAEMDPSEVLQMARAAVPENHVSFLSERPLVHETSGMLFVHAGIRPGVALGAQDPEDLMWIRAPFLDHDAPFDWLVVHGHTAVDRAAHYGNRVNLDSGAGFGRALTVAVFDDGMVYTLGPRGRVVLEAAQV